MQNENPTRGRRQSAGRPSTRTPTRLKAERVQKELRKLPGWRLMRSGAAISRAFQFRSPETPMLFAALVGSLAREDGQHPALTVRDRQVVCRLSSSEVGGVTLQDIKLAQRISLVE